MGTWGYYPLIVFHDSMQGIVGKKKKKLTYELNSAKMFLFLNVILQNGDNMCIASR